MEQVSVEQAARVMTLMAAAGARLEMLKADLRMLQVEARVAHSHALAVKAGSILRGASGLDLLVEQADELASSLVTETVLSEQPESPRLLVSDLPPEMQA